MVLLVRLSPLPSAAGWWSRNGAFRYWPQAPTVAYIRN